MEQIATTGEVLAALSHALDLVEGQPRGHAVRTSMLAMKIARELQLEPSLQESLFYAALLKDVGCSTNSARINKMFGGDEFLAKRKVKTIDWSNQLESVKYAIGTINPAAGIVERLQRMAAMAGSPVKAMDEATAARCNRGAAIARQLGFDQNTANAVQSLDEHWDGRGSPAHLKGEEIPILARILCLSQTLEVFVASFGVQSGLDMVRARSRKWFDPDLVKLICSTDCNALWESLSTHLSGGAVPLSEPESALTRPLTDIDRVAEAFATVIDAKSSFTYEHSDRVHHYSMSLADFFGIEDARKTVLSRAALLHDVGKLGVPNSILDKPSRLSDDEFALVKLHPRFTFEILGQIRGQFRMAEIAANHHERLDGKGYWRGLDASQLDLEMRILAAADVFDALSAKRPYREALPMEKVFEIMEDGANLHLDSDCIQGLRELFGELELAG